MLKIILKYEKLIKKFAKFIIGGFLSYGIKSGVSALFTEVFGLWYLASYIIALIAAIVVNFFYNMHVTFKAKGRQVQRFTTYVLFTIAMMGIDIVFVKLLTDFLGLHYQLSIFMSTVVLLLLKFSVFNKFIFKNKKEVMIVTE